MRHEDWRLLWVECEPAGRVRHSLTYTRIRFEYDPREQMQPRQNRLTTMTYVASKPAAARSEINSEHKPQHVAQRKFGPPSSPNAEA